MTALLVLELAKECNSCYWCASLYSVSSIKCSVCGSDEDVELIPISKNESFKVSHDSRTGIILAFSEQ